LKKGDKTSVGRATPAIYSKDPMAKNFHNKPFDEETILKLKIFQSYTREWLPVFLSKGSFNSIHIFDFFAGPGKDSNGKKGSPLIIIDELKRYLEDPTLPVAPNIDIRLLFNDADKSKIVSLERELSHEDALLIDTTNLSFEESFAAQRDILRLKSAAKLVILDQCGVKQIAGDVFRQLINSPSTDFMFFISSFYLKRFISIDEIRRHFPDMSPEEIRNIPATDVHRFVCRYYQKLVPPENSFYVAPFSIKKGPNIYGIIFGSSILLGLEKFLKVCWELDKVSGQANYNIDDDISWDGPTMFESMNESTKEASLKNDLKTFLSGSSKSNKELYVFTLEHGCLPKHTSKILRSIQNSGHLKTSPPTIRKGVFYVNWENYKQEAKAYFEIKQ